MSQKNCSLALNEKDIETEVEYFEPELKVFINEALNGSVPEDTIHIEGRITVSF